MAHAAAAALLQDPLQQNDRSSFAPISYLWTAEWIISHEEKGGTCKFEDISTHRLAKLIDNMYIKNVSLCEKKFLNLSEFSFMLFMLSIIYVAILPHIPSHKKSPKPSSFTAFLHPVLFTTKPFTLRQLKSIYHPNVLTGNCFIAPVSKNTKI